MRDCSSASAVLGSAASGMMRPPGMCADAFEVEEDAAAADVVRPAGAPPPAPVAAPPPSSSSKSSSSSKPKSSASPSSAGVKYSSASHCAPPHRGVYV